MSHPSHLSIYTVCYAKYYCYLPSIDNLSHTNDDTRTQIKYTQISLTRTHAHTHTHTYTHTNVHTHKRTHTQTYTHTNVRRRKWQVQNISSLISWSTRPVLSPSLLLSLLLPPSLSFSLPPYLSPSLPISPPISFWSLWSCIICGDVQPK